MNEPSSSRTLPTHQTVSPSKSIESYAQDPSEAALDEHDDVLAGEEREEPPDWHWCGLGYDEDHPRAERADIPQAACDQGDDGEPRLADEEAADDSAPEDDDDDGGEVETPLTLRDPGTMTIQEYDNHCAAGHLPWRSSCKACVSGMATEDAHRTKADKGPPP